MFLKFIFVVKCILVFLKVLGHSCLNTSLVQLKIFLLAIVDNLVTYIENENFKGFTMKNTKLCVCIDYTCLCRCMEVCIDNKLVTQIGPPKQKFLVPPLS